MDIGYPSLATERRWTDLPTAYAAITAYRPGEDMSREKNSSPKVQHRKGAMQRSKSTPNVRDVASDENLMDKKRNKLGYHRTAVACGHCRRRKIRCILAIDDPTARCSNCIRLKKDCHFYPVDQQPQLAKGNRSGSKADAGLNDPETSISSSSPGLPGSLIDPIDDFPGSQDVLPLSQEGHYHAGVAGSDRGVLPSNGHEFSPVHGQHSLTSTPFLNHSPGPYDRPAFETHTPYGWQSGDTSFTASFPNIPMTPLSATLSQSSQDHTQSYHIATTRSDVPWPHGHVPMRSMSVGGPMEHQYPPYYQEPYPGIRRSVTSASDMHHMVSGMSHHNISVSGAHIPSRTAMLSYDEQQDPHLAQQGYHSQWHPIPAAHMPGIPNIGHEAASQGWYTPSPSLPHLREEDFSQPTRPP